MSDKIKIRKIEHAPDHHKFCTCCHAQAPESSCDFFTVRFYTSDSQSNTLQLCSNCLIDLCQEANTQINDNRKVFTLLVKFGDIFEPLFSFHAETEQIAHKIMSAWAKEHNYSEDEVSRRLAEGDDFNHIHDVDIRE